MSAGRRCEDCRWWDSSVQLAIADPDTTGACRLMPPVADDRTGKARWPFTDDGDWCGSFSLRPAPASLSAENGKRNAVPTEEPKRQVYRFPELRGRGVPFTRKHIITLMKRGEFPAQIKFGTNRVAWVADEVDRWIDQKIAARHRL